MELCDFLDHDSNLGLRGIHVKKKIKFVCKADQRNIERNFNFLYVDGSWVPKTSGWEASMLTNTPPTPRSEIEKVRDKYCVNAGDRKGTWPKKSGQRSTNLNRFWKISLVFWQAMNRFCPTPNKLDGEKKILLNLEIWPFSEESQENIRIVAWFLKIPSIIEITQAGLRKLSPTFQKSTGNKIIPGRN